jgi:plasmid stability protein
MTRTTLDIDRAVLEQLRGRAATEGKSMGQVASEALAPVLARASSSKERRPFRLIAKDMGRPLIDIDDKQVLGQMLDREYLEQLDR